MSRPRPDQTVRPSLFPNPGLGLGLRRQHQKQILEQLPAIGWFEAITENFIGFAHGSGGPAIQVLEQIRAHYPVALHGVSLSIGSAAPLDQVYLKRLKNLTERIEPLWVSDHLCWTGVEGENLHDLLPLPYTEDCLSHVVERIQAVQDMLGRRIAIENVSSYLSYSFADMSEWEFLAEVARQADCGILLDINNVYVSAVNHGFDPLAYLAGIPPKRVVQFHLAGYSDHGAYLLDTHDAPVTEPVWELYLAAVRRFGPLATNIEWDDAIPAFEVLEAELVRVQAVWDACTNG